MLNFRYLIFAYLVTSFSAASGQSRDAPTAADTAVPESITPIGRTRYVDHLGRSLDSPTSSSRADSIHAVPLISIAERAKELGDLERARKYFGMANDELRRSQPLSQTRARVLNEVISISYRLHSLDRAVAAFDELLPILEANYGKKDTDLAAAFHNYATLLRRVGKNAQADLIEAQASLINNGKEGSCKGIINAVHGANDRFDSNPENLGTNLNRSGRTPNHGDITSAPNVVLPASGYDATALSNAYDAMERGAFDEAIRLFAPLADGNVVEAQVTLARMYDNGKGIKQDHKKAIYWYGKAAQLGNADAQNALGYFHSKGLGVPQDDKVAARWFYAAANAGDPQGMFNLGVMTENGTGTKQDASEARRLYERAANLKYADAKNNLARMYETGQGGERNAAKAFALYSEAAKSGSSVGKYNTGRMYLEGVGVEKNAVKGRQFMAESKITAGSAVVAKAASTSKNFVSVEIPKELFRSDRMVVVPLNWRAERYHTPVNFDLYAKDVLRRISKRVRLDLDIPKNLVASFTIASDGQLSDLKLLQGCDDKAWDKAVSGMIESSAPYRPLPIGAAGSVNVTMRIGLNRSHETTSFGKRPGPAK